MKLAPTAKAIVYGVLVDIGGSIGEMRAVSVVAAIAGLASLVPRSGAYAFEWTAVLGLVVMGAVSAGGWAGTQRKRRSAA